MGQLVLSARIRGQATTQCVIDGGGQIGPTSVALTNRFSSSLTCPQRSMCRAPVPQTRYSPLPEEVSLYFIASPTIAGGKIEVETCTITSMAPTSQGFRAPGWADAKIGAIENLHARR